MTEQEALNVLTPPGKRRTGKAHGGIIQVWVTRACDRGCFGCTQGSNLKGPRDFITPWQFEQACISLRGYFGVVGVFGGNPCLHPQFPELCQILERRIPKPRRGLWANRLFGHGELCRRVFNTGFSNLNVHLDKEAAAEIRRTWPEVRIWGEHCESRHGPPYVAMQDLDRLPNGPNTEENRWNLITQCDINRHWSAMIGVFRGKLRAWFCEIAGAQSILHQHDPEYPDTGLVVTADWWQQPMNVFAHQARFHCHACGVPLRIKGELASATYGTEQVTKTHLDIYKPKLGSHQVQVVTELDQVEFQAVEKFTHYLQNAK